MTKPKILIVEDDEGLNSLIQRTLEKEGFPAKGVSTGTQAITTVTENPDSLLLLDYLLPEMTAKEVISALDKKKFKVPFIIMTGHGDEKIAIKLMKLGARDYIVKERGFLELLPIVIKQVINELNTEQKLIKAQNKLVEHQEQLEELVKKRTSELLENNRNLQVEIGIRIQAEKKLLDYQKQLQSLTSQMSLIEEHEKRRIATELHDCIGQTLALSKIKLRLLNKSAHSSEIKNSIKEIIQLIEQTIKETRTLTFELSPPILYELGLSQAVKWLIDQFREKHGIKITLEDDGHDKPFDNNIRFFLFQAVRELLVNVAKHAHADKVKIKMLGDNTNLRITVQDDGIGFSGSSANYSGYGLFNIRERMNHINGHFEIKSVPGHGTRITMIAPFKLNQKK